MFQEFYKINKTKFFLLLKVTLVFTFGTGIISLLGKHERSSIILVIPVLVQFLIHLYDFVKFQRMIRVLKIQPLIKLTEIGFKESYSYRSVNWISPKPILKGYIDNFPIKCEVENGTLIIIADIKRDLNDYNQKEKLISVFGKENIKYDLLGIGLVYDTLRQKKITFQELLSELNQFVEILKSEDSHCNT